LDSGGNNQTVMDKQTRTAHAPGSGQQSRLLSQLTGHDMPPQEMMHDMALKITYQHLAHAQPKRQCAE
jgi:hypothetical protein